MNCMMAAVIGTRFLVFLDFLVSITVLLNRSIDLFQSGLRYNEERSHIQNKFAKNDKDGKHKCQYNLVKPIFIPFEQEASN